MNESQFVIFTLGNEEYGIKISFIQEIIRIPQKITQVPNMPEHIKGVVNLRDKIIPVVNLKKRFGLEIKAVNTDERLLVINISGTLFSIIVDDVSEVVKIAADAIEKFDVTGYRIENSCIKGIGKIGERLIVLIDAVRLNEGLL